MADPVPLDPGTYRGTYKLAGGSLALDFANLVSYRGTERQHDWLEPASNLRRWAEATGVTAPAEADNVRLRGVRDLVARVFLAVADGDTPADEDVHVIGGIAAAAWSRRRLRFPRGAPAARWEDDSSSLLTEVAEDAATLLTSGDALARVSACDECRWVYLDTTRNRSRRWCDPRDCGNRARQRRHYHRRHHD